MPSSGTPALLLMWDSGGPTSVVPSASHLRPQVVDTQPCPAQKEALFLRARVVDRQAQPSNFFLRPSIPLSASMFLRQSPTSRFSWSYGVRGESLLLLCSLHLPFSRLGSSAMNARPPIWF